MASGQRPAASSHFPVHVRAVGAGVFFQSLRHCARCKQGSHCALTCMESELGAKSPPVRRWRRLWLRVCAAPLEACHRPRVSADAVAGGVAIRGSRSRDNRGSGYPGERRAQRPGEQQRLAQRKRRVLGLPSSAVEPHPGCRSPDEGHPTECRSLVSQDPGAAAPDGRRYLFLRLRRRGREVTVDLLEAQ